MPLPPEPWGSKFRRAREDVAGYKLEVAAEAVSRYKLTSASALSRMEKREGPPPNRSARGTAYIACVIYGVDPADLDLDPDDVPAALLGMIKRGRRPKNAWFTAGELRPFAQAA